MMNASQRPLPHGWRWVRLDQALQMADSGIWGEPDPDNGISVLRSTNFRNDGTFALSDLALRAIPAEKRDQKALLPGDIVLERSGGGPKQPVGRVCFFEGDKRDHTFGNFCQRLRARSEICDARFLFWHLYLFHMSGQTQLYQTQTTGIRNLEYKRYLAQELPLPPLSEQQRIAAILSEQMEAVEQARAAAEARLEAAKALPAAYLRAVFDSPEAQQWPRRRIGEFTETASGSTPPRDNPEYFGGAIPWVKTGELKDDVVSVTDEQVTDRALRDTSLTLLPIRTLLIAMIGQGQTRGRTGVLALPAAINQNCFAILPNPSEFDPSYLQLWFRHNYLALRSKSGARGVSQPALNGEILRDLNVPLPPLSEQFRVIGTLDGQLKAVERLRKALEAQLEMINQLPGALLRQAFSGEL